jgi:hypothetical protein
VLLELLDELLVEELEELLDELLLLGFVHATGVWVGACGSGTRGAPPPISSR